MTAGIGSRWPLYPMLAELPLLREPDSVPSSHPLSCLASPGTDIYNQSSYSQPLLRKRIMTTIAIRLSISAFMILALMVVSAGSLMAQAVSIDLACTCQVNQTYTVVLCIGGANYNANVKFCETNFTSPNLPWGICATTLRQNRYSVLREVCFTAGYPVGATHAQIPGAVLWSI